HESVLRLGEAVGVGCLPAADARDADRNRFFELRVHSPKPLEEQLTRGAREAHERAERVLAVVEERARRGRAESTRERIAPRLRDENDVRLVEIAPEPRCAALEIAAQTAACELLEEVLDEVLLRELLDDLHLLDPHRDLARDRSTQLDPCAPLRDQQADELAGRDERDRESAAPAPAGQLGTELREPESLTSAAGLGVARLQVEL